MVDVLTLRRARKGDSRAVFGVLVSAFDLKRGTRPWREKRDLVQHHPQEFMVMERQGTIVATLHIRPQYLRVGRAKILKADVGEVAVLKGLQGRGLGTRLMAGCVERLRKEGFHISRLGGLNEFYSRFGYVPFPRRYYVFPLEPSRAGARVLRPKDFLPRLDREEDSIRPFDPRRDLRRCQELYEEFNACRSGSVVREELKTEDSLAEPDPGSMSIVFQDKGVITGYVMASQHDHEDSPFEGRVRIWDAAFERGESGGRAFKALMAHLLRRAADQRVMRVTARLPFDPHLQNLLIEAGLPFVLEELQSAPASNMLLLVNLKALLESIGAELTDRLSLAPSHEGFTLRFEVGRQQATLRILRSSVEVVDDEGADAVVSCGTGAFLRWVLGIRGFAEWQEGVDKSLDQSQASVLAALFPSSPCASGPWG